MIKKRIRRFIKIFWLCPIFWYFASVHIRDAVVLFSISLLCLVWIIYLKNSVRDKFGEVSFIIDNFILCIWFTTNRIYICTFCNAFNRAFCIAIKVNHLFDPK